MGRQKRINFVGFAKTRKPGKKFVVDAYDATGSRTRRYFTGRTEAEQFADRLRAQFESVGSLLDLSDVEKEALIESRQLGVNLRELLRDFVSRREQDLTAAAQAAAATKVEVCLNDWLKDLSQTGRSARYKNTVSGFFARVMKRWAGLPVQSITAEIVAAEVHMVPEDGTELSASTRVGYRRMLHGFFAHAISRGWREDNPVTAVKAPRGLNHRDEEIGVLTPEQSRRLLAAAAAVAPTLLPALGIALFAGLRSGELQRLDWAEVWLERGLVMVRAGTAKTGSRRMVTMEPPLTDLLYTRRPPVKLGENGNPIPSRVWPKNGMRLWDRTLKAAGWAGHKLWVPASEPGAPPWPANAMRHSFVSYHVATFQDVARTALEAGHSVEILHRHYRQLVTKDAGEEFWTLRLEG